MVRLELAREQPRLGSLVKGGARSRGALRGGARRIVRDLEARVERASGQPYTVHVLAGYTRQRRLLRDKPPHTGAVVVDEVFEQTRRVHFGGRVDGHAHGPVADRRQPDGCGRGDKAAWCGSLHKLGCSPADEALCVHAERVAGVRSFREDGHEPLTRRHPPRVGWRRSPARLRQALRPIQRIDGLPPSASPRLPNPLYPDQVIRENPANRGTETSAEVLVGPPWRMESNAGQQQWY